MVNPLACHVMGPLSPTTCMLTARRLPINAGSAGACTNGRAMPSLQTDWPGSMLTAGLPPNWTAWLLFGSSTEPVCCRPTYTPSSVTGLVPNTLVKCSRVCGPQRAGRTINRTVWSFSPVAGAGMANRMTGWADALPDGYGPCADAVQLAAQCGACAAATPGKASVVASAIAPFSRMRRLP